MPSQRRYLADTGQLLWPAPARITFGRRPRGPHARVRSYAVVPTPANPKLLVPSRPNRTAAQAVRSYNTGGPRRQRAMLAVLAAGLRVGLGSVYPYRMHVTDALGAERDDIEQRLSEICGRPVRVALFVTPPRAVRKPVLQVIDEQGCAVGYAKVGVDAFTRSLLTAEAAAVQRLTGSELTSIGLPQILHHGDWRGNGLLLQSALPRGEPAHSDRPEVARGADELTRALGVVTSPLTASSYWQQFRRRLRALPTGAAAQRIERSAEVLATRAGDVSVEFGCSHGDWAPWNMTIAGDRLLVWDWEKFACDVPVGFDAVHFAVQESVVLHRADIVEAFARAHAQLDRKLPGDLNGAVGAAGGAPAELGVWLYALEIAVRYLEDREAERGRTRMSRLDDWLDPVLSVQETRRRPAAGARR